MKRLLTDATPNRFDSARFEELPDCSLPEAAWMAGVAEEAMRRYLEEANAVLVDGSIPITNLVRALFTLLGRKENQSAMLRMQLSTTLERERELSETLRAGLLGSGVPMARPPEARPPEPRVATPVSPPVTAKTPPPRKKKKK
ncbi:MAG: hypothetical protein HQL94_05350 [Magnetococcales bacterium]|nr:hypothetical protein [Magnetococcales bacterium]MBF0437836.1 hypothetical protein [Magnetococcales bacterium]